MDVTLSIWALAAVIIISILIGYWAGRLIPERDGAEEEMAAIPGKRLGPGMESAQAGEQSGTRYQGIVYGSGTFTGMEDAPEEEKGSDEARSGEGKSSPQGRKVRGGMRLPDGIRIPLGWAIGSPVAGEVNFFYEGSRRGALIHPIQETLYAPAPGKITRLYPSGNAFRLRTDYGVELLIQVGIGTGELEGGYFRPRVVQNEIVGKGKLLLEFDKAGIEAEGCDPSVLLSVEEADNYRDITITDVLKVKTGEDLLWVRR